MRKSPAFNQMISCKNCGVLTKRTGPTQQFCKQCSEQRSKERKIAFYHKMFPNAKPKTKSQEVCCVCGGTFSCHLNGKPYCNKHYQRLITNGTTELVGRKKTNTYTTENGIVTVHMKCDKSFLIDESDLELVRPYSCCLSKTGYVVARIDGKVQRVHRFIIGAKAGEVVDHINGNTLDNRRANLRICTAKENARNTSASRTSKTGFPGIRITKFGKYNVRIMVNRKNLHIGNFDDLASAIDARKAAEIKYFGEFSPSLSRISSKPL